MSQPNFFATIMQHGGDLMATVFVPGHDPIPVGPQTPNASQVIQAAAKEMTEPGSVSTDEILDLLDVRRAIERTFQERLSDRVTVRGDEILLDGDVMDNALSQQILRFLDEGVSDWEPLVLFLEKVVTNPDDVSRESLYSFLRANPDGMSIDQDGDIVAYKGVTLDEDGVSLVSVRSGPGIVNGEEMNGQLPNNPGDVVEMARSEVENNPSVACSVGLHVATHNYASTWSGSVQKVVEVKVNPRDVVSVPHDSGAQKVRVCRYTVMREVEKPYSSASVNSETGTENVRSEFADFDFDRTFGR